MEKLADCPKSLRCHKNLMRIEKLVPRDSGRAGRESPECEDGWGRNVDITVPDKPGCAWDL